MKIVYIPVTKKITQKNFLNYVKCFLYDIYIVIKNFFFYRKASKDTSGYIESAIHSNAYTLELPYNYCIIFSKILNFLFDGIFVNWKFTNTHEIKEVEYKLLVLSKKFKIKKVIVDITDTSENFIKDEILDGFDYVIKREKNKSISNKKYFTTMLPCKLVNYRFSKKKENIDWKKIGNTEPNMNEKYDIFFSGQPNSKSRVELIKFLIDKNYNFFGGVENSIITYDQYLKCIYNSSINLALKGKGEFTFRHLEILASCSFMLCDKSISQLELPLPLEEGKHFVSFENKEDLIQKIDFYLRHQELRKEIAFNGRQLLEKNYSPKKHGEFILKKIYSA